MKHRQASSAAHTSASARLAGARVLHLVQWVSLASGALLCAGYAMIVVAGELDRRAAVDDFSAVSSALFSQAPDQSLWSTGRVRDFLASRNFVVDEPVAILRVASLSLVVPVYPDSSGLHLNRGAGLIDGMTGPDEGGNVGMAGHRDGYFRVLKNIAVGDRIEIQTHRRVHIYRVTSIDVVPESDTTFLRDTTDPTVTLVTCYPFYFIGNAPQRFIVRGAYEWAASKASS